MNVEKLREGLLPLVRDLDKISVQGENLYYPGTSTEVSEVGINAQGEYEIWFKTFELNDMSKEDCDYNDEEVEYQLRRNFERLAADAFPSFRVVKKLFGEKTSWGYRVAF